MLEKIKFVIRKIHSENCKYLIETEIDVLRGIKDVDVNYKSGKCQIEFNNSEISDDKIFKAIKELGYEIGKEECLSKSSIKECTYFVAGMHCASCELLIEKRLLKEEGIKSVESSASKGRVVIEYEGEKPTISTLDKIFKENKYTFSEKSIDKKQTKSPLLEFNKNKRLIINREKLNNLLIISGVALLFIVAFLILHKSGISALVSVNAKSALPMFLVFGLLAGFSSCAALIGGIILSMSKQWAEIHSKDKSTFYKLEPHILFNVGRLVSYAAFGAILGSIGSFFKFSTTFLSVLVILVSVIMFFLALQMLGLKYFQKFQITTPKFITRYIADESNFQGRYMPFLMGAATFFLPCGFTITAQGLALTSGSIWQGSLIMLFFAPPRQTVCSYYHIEP